MAVAIDYATICAILCAEVAYWVDLSQAFNVWRGIPMGTNASLRERVLDRTSAVVGATPPDVDELRLWLGLTQEELAESVGRSRRTVARWSRSAPDHATARGATARILRQLNRVQFLLDDVMGREAALTWLRSPNRGFRGEAPLDLILARRTDELLAALEALADGGPQ